MTASAGNPALEGLMLLLAGTGIRVRAIWDDSCQSGLPSAHGCGSPPARRFLVVHGQPLVRVLLATYCSRHVPSDPGAGLREAEAVEVSEDELTVLRVMSS